MTTIKSLAIDADGTVTATFLDGSIVTTAVIQTENHEQMSARIVELRNQQIAEISAQAADKEAHEARPQEEFNY